MKFSDKPRMDKRQKTLAEHTQKQKDTLIEELAKCPIVQVACERTSIGRATYYKWRSEDTEFRRVSDKAVDEGRKFVNDIAESQMIRKIKEGNMTSIIYWLKNNSPRYTEKRTEEVESLGVLPPEQAKELIRAMHLMGLNELVKRSKKLEKVFRESEEEVESNPLVNTSKTEYKTQLPKKTQRGGVVNLSEFIKKHRKP
ncbi:MAG: hypothetical protein RL292_527 [Candidatus Parcubacteria bacterium]